MLYIKYAGILPFNWGNLEGEIFMAKRPTVIDDLTFYIRDGVMDFQDYFVPLDAISLVKLDTPKSLLSGHRNSILTIQNNSGSVFQMKHKNSNFLNELMTIIKTERTNSQAFYLVDVQKGSICNGDKVAADAGFNSTTKKTIPETVVTVAPVKKVPEVRPLPSTNMQRSTTSSCLDQKRSKTGRPRYYSASEYVRNHGVVTDAGNKVNEGLIKGSSVVEDIFAPYLKDTGSDKDHINHSISKKDWTDIEYLFFQKKSTFARNDMKYTICEKLEDLAYRKDRRGMRDYFKSLPKEQLRGILASCGKDNIKLLTRIIH